PAEIDPLAQAAARLHSAAHQREMRTAAELQSLVFLPRMSVLVGVEQPWLGWCGSELFPHKIADPIDHLRAFALVEKSVISRGENVHAFHRRRETVKKFALHFHADHPIAPCRKHQRRDVNRAGISKEPRAGLM